MPVMSRLLILGMIIVLLIPSSGLQAWAQIQEDTQIIPLHSVDELEQDAKVIQEESGIFPIKSDETVDIESDITRLIAAKIEYATSEASTIQPIFITNPFENESEITNSLTKSDRAFENFIEITEVPLIESITGSQIKLKRATKKETRISGVKWKIGTSLRAGTIIATKSGEEIDAGEIDTRDVTHEVLKKAKEYQIKKNPKKKSKKSKEENNTEEFNAEVFEFGIPGKHLIFSSPVMLSINTPNYSDGFVVDIAVLHEGDTEFNTLWLSTQASTLCNADGSSTKWWSKAIVKNGKITFYTCGASSFTINPTGGWAWSNDLRIIVWDCAQVQIYYNNLQQIYNGNPPATGCSAWSNMDAWPVLRIGNTSYGNDFTAWSTNTTTGSTTGNTYTATSTMTRVVGGLTYTVIIDWEHTAPNKFLTWKWRVIVPPTNTQNIRFYYGMDSAVAGVDTNDVGYYTNTGGQTVGIYDSVANIVSAFRYINGPAWSGYQANWWNTVRTQIQNGANFTNTVQNTGGDLGFGINWNFWTTANVTYSGTVEWRLLPYVAWNAVDLIPGIGQPEWPLTTGYISQLPITLTNAGNITSSGVHTAVLTLPTSISGPVSSFNDNGWFCGAQVWTTVTCTKTTAIDPLASETFRIPVIPLPAAGGTNVNFIVNISNPGDSNTGNNSANANNAVVASTLAYAPGWVTGMTFWVKADGNKNCNTNGCTVTTWSNSGTLGTAANAVTWIGTVTYDTNNLINYNPTLYFNNAAFNTNSNLSITTAAASIFTTTKIWAGGIFRIGTQTATNNALDWSSTPALDRLARYNSNVIYNGANQRANGSSDISAAIRATNGTAISRTDGIQTLTNAAITTWFTSSSIGIGRTVATSSVLANVWEIIVYPSEITAVNRNKIESYLAIKYGNTLNQTTAQNYTLSNNAIAWNASNGTVYNKNIAGIARDDVSSLNQTKSQSIDNTGDIIVNSVSAIGSNYQSLIWGNDGNSTNVFTTTDAPTNYSRINREWQFQEKNGNIWNVKIAYPATSLPSGAGNPIYMFVDNDGIFASGTSIYTGTLNAGNWEFTVNIGDLQYVTFGQVGDIVPPTILTNSKSSGALLPIGNFTIVNTYSDTGSLINPLSYTGRLYSWNTTGATWNTTNIAPSYMSITGATSTTTGTLLVNNLPFGKYRVDVSISDNAGNTQTQSYTYFVDAVEWSVSGDTYDIGTAVPNTSTFWSGNLTVTVKTVGAGFTLKMTSNNTLATWPENINYWDGVKWWGYDTGWWILGNTTNTTVATQWWNINQNGLKNTYTYNLKYGLNITAEMVAGIYNGTIKLDLILNY